MEDITDKILSDKYCYDEKLFKYVEIPKKKKKKKKKKRKIRLESSDSQFGDESSEEDSFYFCKGIPPAVVLEKRNWLRKQRAMNRSHGKNFYAKRVIFPKRRKKKLDDLNAMKYRYQQVGDTDSDLGSDWENYVNYLWNSYEEKIPEDWRKLIHNEAEYFDEMYISTDGEVTTFRQLLRRDERIKRRKKRRTRDPDFDNTKRNTCWKCEWPKGDSSDTESVYHIPTSNLSVTSGGSAKEGLPKRYLTNQRIVERTNKLVERLSSYGGVTNVLIAINQKVAATNIADKGLVSYLMEYFYPLLTLEWVIMKDFDLEDDLLGITFETNNFDLICGVGFGGAQRESFAIMLYQLIDKDFAEVKPIEGSIEKPTTVDFPKVWLKGIEKRPESPPQIHLRKFREATGLKPLKEKPFKDLDNVQPMLRTGLHNTYAEWREAVGVVEGKQIDEKVYKVPKKKIKFIKSMSSGSEAERIAKLTAPKYGPRKKKEIIQKVEFTGSADSEDEETN